MNLNPSWKLGIEAHPSGKRFLDLLEAGEELEQLGDRRLERDLEQLR